MFELAIIGNVGGIRLNQSEKSTVLTISVAANRKAVDGTSYTDWASAKIWGDRAIALEKHVCKGQKILVRGRPEVSAYVRQDGQAAAELVVHARDFEFVGSKPLLAVESKPKRKKAR